jgi:cellulose synthase/poly-beta-1,6-N-acetylglucosamine synthase-like glycosyltransferase
MAAETLDVHSEHAAPLPGAGSHSGRSARARVFVVVVFGLLTLLLATRVVYFINDPVLGVYAIVMMVVLAIVMGAAFGFYRDPSFDAPLTTERPLVSCLVAVKNELEMIDDCIASVLASDYQNLELIVVDDGSTDGTSAHLLMAYGDHPRIRLLLLSQSVGKKRALTVAAEQTRGDFLVFTDSDCVLDRQAVSRVMAAFAAHPDIGALAGHARAHNRDQNLITRIQDTWYENQFSVSKAAESVFGAVTCVSGPLAAFRREAIYNFLPAWADDTFLGREFRFATDRQLTGYVLGGSIVGAKLKRRYADSSFVRDQDYPTRAWRVEYVKSARVTTVVPWSFRRLIKQQVRWKKSFVRNQFFTGAFYWRRGPLPAFVFYSRSLFVLAMPVMLVRHLVYLPVRGDVFLGALYFLGVIVKGFVWAAAYKAENPKCKRWIYRPLMSLMIIFCFSPLILYSVATIRRNVWARG